MTDKEPSFSKRIELLAYAAAIVAAEVDRMTAAEKRFAERRRAPKQKASR